MSKGKRSLILRTAIACGLLSIVAVASLAFPVRGPALGHFGNRAWIGPVHVGGLTRTAARERLDHYVYNLAQNGIPVIIDSRVERVENPAQLGLSFDPQASIVGALRGGESGWARWRRRLFGADYYILKWRLDEDQFTTRVTQLAQQVYRAPKNAVIHPQTGVVIGSEMGRALDVGAVRNAVGAWAQEVARSGNRVNAEETGGGVRDAGASTAQGKAPALHLPVIGIRPQVTGADLRALADQYPGLGRTLLTGFTTHFDLELHNRTSNLILAARLIDGYVLLPGDTFSFNEIVGPREYKTGFAPAPEIVGEVFVEGVGGGICQVSSTLYNAVLYADLQVIERYRHSVPLGYVPPGRDATLYYGVMDFRFRNTLQQPIVVRAEVESGGLRVSLWGTEELTWDVRLKSVERVITPTEVVEIDPSLPSGTRVVDEEGSAGRWIFVEKQVRDAATGEILREEAFSRNHYPPEPKRVRVGIDKGP